MIVFIICGASIFFVMRAELISLNWDHICNGIWPFTEIFRKFSLFDYDSDE